MHETLLSLVYCDAVKAHPACVSLAGVLQWQTPESKATNTPPVVIFSARDVVPIGHKGYCTATLEMKLESENDDQTTRDTHIARANLLLAAVNDEDPETNLKDAINRADPLRIVHRGHVVTGGGRGVAGRNWTASVLLRVLFSPA